MTAQRRVRCSCCRTHRKALSDLVSAIDQSLTALDTEMKKPSDNSRGQRVAHIANYLDMQKQIAKRFTLDSDNCKALQSVQP